MTASVTEAPTEDVAYLLSPRAVRAAALRALAAAEAGTLAHFSIDWGKWDAIVDRVLALVKSYPAPQAIPPHSRMRHFAAGGEHFGSIRLAALDRMMAKFPPREALRARFDLIVPSVLLDAGAGAAWSYHEAGTNLILRRSEGLAIASMHMFSAGGFSHAPGTAPLRADADRLAVLPEADVAEHFQVAPENPLVGLAGRTALMQRLGEVVGRDGSMQAAAACAGEGVRIGHLADLLVDEATNGQLPAERVLARVLAVLGPIWPGRLSRGNVNLGDTWSHPTLGLVPFHKLSQWLTYSLLEPLALAGVTVTDLDALTGLAEYRNGGLFLDGGVLALRDENDRQARHQVGDPLVVEWRALTVALLDRVAADLRARLRLDAAAFPLAKVLEAGTWRAGREIAASLREDASPPLQIISDGTVF